MPAADPDYLCTSGIGHDHTMDDGTKCRFCGHVRAAPADPREPQDKFAAGADAHAETYRQGWMAGQAAARAEGRPPETRIDVERLAKAFHAIDHPAIEDCRLGLGMEPRPEWAGRRFCEHKVAALLAEYDRLSEAPTAPEPAEGTRCRTADGEHVWSAPDVGGQECAACGATR